MEVTILMEFVWETKLVLMNIWWLYDIERRQSIGQKYPENTGKTTRLVDYLKNNCQEFSLNWSFFYRVRE